MLAAICRSAYNLDKQITLITRPDGGTIGFDYDNGGRLETQTLPSGQGQLVYDYNETTGNLSSITGPGSNVLSFTYDGSLLKSETWSGEVSGSVSRMYDNDFRVISQSVNGGHTVTFDYDDDGLLTRAGDMTIIRDPDNGLITATILGNITDARTYNGFGELQTYTASYTGEPPATLYAVEYERDELGRITHRNESIDGGTPVDTFYRYDAAGRLYRVCADAACTTIQSEYHYDANGNRIACEPEPNETQCTFTATHGALLNAEYDAQDRLLSTQHTALSTSYTYTDNGELLTREDASGATSYTYDALGNLRAVSLPNTDPITYVIDGANRRVGKKVDGTLERGFLYENQLRIVAELDGSGDVASRFVYGEKINAPEYMVKASTTYRIITDHLGSPRLVVSITDGSVAQHIDYDEFGNLLVDMIPGFQPLGFAGGLSDPDTKLIRFGLRDYDATAGRWGKKDPIRFAGGDANLFGYVLSDPINRTDTMGLQAAAVSALRDFVRNYLEMRDANTIGKDKYYHCMANCQVAARGLQEEEFGRLISELREQIDERIKGDSRQQCDDDRRANDKGRDAGSRGYSCQAVCGGL